MAFHPDVVPGQNFVPSALLSNNVRRIVNHLNGFGALRQNGAGSGTVRIQVYNASDDSIGAGTAVNFPETGVFCDGAIPAIHLVDPAKPWGVVTRKLDPAEMGDCFISGPVTVAVTGNGDFAQPSSASPDVFTRGSAGAPVLFESNGKGLLNLGAGTPELYDGPFALIYDAETNLLKIKTGYLSRNGEFLQVPETEIVPQTGFVCVESILDESGTWSEPAVKFGFPGQMSYPVGSCRIDGESVTVTSFRVPVAILIVTDACDVTE